MKPVRLTHHAQEQALARGATIDEIVAAIRHGPREPTKHDRQLCRYNVPFDQLWQGRRYPLKQVVPVIKEEAHEIFVITVYTFYF